MVEETTVIYHGLPDPRVTMQSTTNEIIAQLDLHHATGGINPRSSIIPGLVKIEGTVPRDCVLKCDILRGGAPGNRPLTSYRTVFNVVPNVIVVFVVWSDTRCFVL